MLGQLVADFVPVRFRTDEAVKRGAFVYGCVQGAKSKSEKTGPRIAAAEEWRAALGARQAVNARRAVVEEILFTGEDAKRLLPRGSVCSERRSAVFAAPGTVAISQHLKPTDFVGDGSAEAATEVHTVSPVFLKYAAAINHGCSAGANCRACI
jgi:hypothetical protein